MIIDASANIKWLTERLWTVSREMQVEGITHPTFVLLTKNKDDRQAVESLIWKFYEEKFGAGMFNNVMPGASTDNHTRFHLPELSASIVLVDI